MIWTDLAILFGAAFTVATCIALGSLWLRLIRLPFQYSERWIFSFLCGGAILSAVIFVLCCIDGVHRGVLSGIGVAAIASAGWVEIRNRGARRPPPRPPTVPGPWRIVFALVFTLFGALYFLNAMAPETSPDGVAYHLWLAQTYLRAHGFVRLDSFYAHMPQGLEMLFLFALAFGRNSSAALVHFAFLMSLPLLMLSYGRRAGIVVAAAAAALFVFVSPIAGVDGTTSYNDIAMTALLFAVFHLLQIWSVEQRTALLITSGGLAGFAYSMKYTAAFGIVYAVGLVLWKLWRHGQPWLRPTLALCLAACVFVLPWTLKSWIWAGNPVPPFANRMFPNRSVHITYEENLKRLVRRYDLNSPIEIPVELMLHGGTLGGILGPLFFAAPLGLWALRRPQGRVVLLAAAVLLVPYFSNIGTRFVLPALPFISIAMALALNDVWTASPRVAQNALLAIVILNAAVCWPSIVGLYAPSGIWRIPGWRFRPALRLEPENVWLSREFPPSSIGGMIDQFVPAGKKVFAFSIPGRAYAHREITASYESAAGDIRRDILLTPLIADWHPTRVLDFAFAPRNLRRLRLVQTAASEGALWSVSEMRVYADGKELARMPSWRLTAQPNPWDAGLAFDNLAVTRWRSWQPAAPGMYLEVDFGTPTAMDLVRVQSTTDESETKCRVEGMGPDAREWKALADNPKQVSVESDDVNLRREATYAVKQQGYDFLLIENNSLGADDYLRRAYAWNIELQAERAGSRLYKLLP